MRLALRIAAAAAFAWISAAAVTAATTQKTTSDFRFIENAGTYCLFEIQLGELAILRSPSDQIQQLGTRMAADSDELAYRLQSIAAKTKVTLPGDVNRQYQSRIDDLIEISGPAALAAVAFDQAYVREVIQTEEAQIAGLDTEISRGSSSDLRNWARNARPVLQEHLRIAKTAEEYLNSVSQVFKKK